MGDLDFEQQTGTHPGVESKYTQRGPKSSSREVMVKSFYAGVSGTLQHRCEVSLWEVNIDPGQ